MKIKFNIVVVSFALISTLFLSGCNTTEGFGKDMKQGGQAIQDAATQDNTTK